MRINKNGSPQLQESDLEYNPKSLTSNNLFIMVHGFHYHFVQIESKSFIEIIHSPA